MKCTSTLVYSGGEVLAAKFNPLEGGYCSRKPYENGAQIFILEV
jgi:hypothetical protein